MISTESLNEDFSGPDVLYRAALREGDRRGIVLVVHARWEERVLSRPMAKMIFFAADDHPTAAALARVAMEACRTAGVALVSAAPGHSPLYMHAALCDAGFHVASQALTVRADLQSIQAAVARIPLRGKFRPAVEADIPAIMDIAGRAFTDARFMADPHFPAEWGAQLMRAWARNLVLGGADEVIVAEGKGELLGFATMALTLERRRKIPVLLAAEPRYDGMGVGAMLVRIMLDWYRERGMRVFFDETQKSNVKINTLYSRLGFTALDSNLVYHASPGLETYGRLIARRDDH